jgi:xanthine dehydrogenase accessory factor
MPRFLGRSADMKVDPWTAVIALFHDHDWEIDLLLQALGRRPFFIGATVSRRTHANDAGD